MIFAVLISVVSLVGAFDYPIESDNVTFINGDPMMNPNLFEGDIIGHDPAANVIKGSYYRWPNGIIHYTFESGFYEEDRLQITNAMKHIETATHNCIQFKVHEYEPDYISIFRGQGCYSNVGRIGNEQKVSLGQGCEPFGTAVHELTHAIGFFHEQSRSDRDSFITVDFDHIKKSLWPQFNKTPLTFEQRLTKFDFNSIMLYGSNAFSDDGQRTMYKKDGSSIISPHIKPGLSNCDVKRIGLAYNCAKAASVSC